MKKIRLLVIWVENFDFENRMGSGTSFIHFSSISFAIFPHLCDNKFYLLDTLYLKNTKILRNSSFLPVIAELLFFTVFFKKIKYLILIYLNALKL